MCGAGTNDSAAVPVNLSTGANSGGFAPTDSVVLENPNRIPNPTEDLVLCLDSPALRNLHLVLNLLRVSLEFLAVQEISMLLIILVLDLSLPLQAQQNL